MRSLTMIPPVRNVSALGITRDADIARVAPGGFCGMQVTPVGGSLVRLRDGALTEVTGGESITSAEHGYLPAAGLALFPSGFGNTVIALRLAW